MNNMNAKEEVLKILKQRLKYHEYHENNLLAKETESIITAVENAIFDVPSVEVHGHSEYANGFRDGINFILNYKKPESEE